MAAQKQKLYYCPMHPNYTSDKPGTCPICGMNLVKRKDAPDAKETTPGQEHVAVNIDLHKQQLIGIRTAKVEHRPITKNIRTYGNVEDVTKRYNWVTVQIFEQDLGFVDVGQEVEVAIPAYHEKAKGIVRSVGKIIDPATRTVAVNVELLKYRGELISNMLVDIYIAVELSNALLIPREALMDTGIKQLVFVKTGEGRFEPRTIQKGWETDQDVEVKSGLKEGETIVVGGNFLLDSESRLQAALGGMSAQEGEHQHGQ